MVPTTAPTATPTSVSAPPVITDVTRDKHVMVGPPHISDWVQVTFDSLPGVTYDIYRSPSMTAPAWVVAGNVTAAGASTTWTDSGPVNVERYYRIAIQGSLPVIYSTNEGGVLPSTVLDKNGAEMSQAAMLGASLNTTEAATTIQEVIGWQMVGSDIPDTSSEMWAWEPLANGYTLAWLIDGMGPTYDGTWWDNNLGGPATIDMSLGAGFWAFNRQTSVQTVFMDGIVQQTPYPMTVYVNATATRSHQIGQPAAGDVNIQDAEFFLDGGKGSDIPDTADEIWQFDQVSNGFTLTWLMNGFGPTYDGKWWDNNLGDFSTVNLARGTGWWYFSKADALRTPSWTWTEPVPY
jgi:hypothetical protein